MDKVWTFNEIKKYDHIGPDQKILRKRIIQTEYDKYIHKYKPISCIIIRTILENDYDHKILIELNKFPYNIDSGITQYVVWINPMYKTNEDYIRYFVNKYVTPQNYSLYKHDIKHGSIPEIEHYHLFIKKNSYIPEGKY